MDQTYRSASIRTGFSLVYKSDFEHVQMSTQGGSNFPNKNPYLVRPLDFESSRNRLENAKIQYVRWSDFRLYLVGSNGINRLYGVLGMILFISLREP